MVERILEDMRTTSRWFFIVMMGRSAGHLALGAGKAAGAPITLIPEEFRKRPIQLEDVVRTLEGAIVKRLARGRPDGVAVIAEGIAEYFDPNDPILRDVAARRARPRAAGRGADRARAAHRGDGVARARAASR